MRLIPVTRSGSNHTTNFMPSLCAASPNGFSPRGNVSFFGTQLPSPPASRPRTSRRRASSLPTGRDHGRIASSWFFRDVVAFVESKPGVVGHWRHSDLALEARDIMRH